MPPVQLIEEVADGAYAVCEPGRAFLRGLAADLPLAVVVVAGRYRTGKSFLLNRGILNAPARGGFATGSTVKACTKGVWLYPSVLTGEGDAAFVVLDTEGTASMEASLAHDAKLLGIVLALASVFVYNSVGAVDETALSELGTVTAVASELARADGQLWSAPHLVWALRDFTLELLDEAGRVLTPDEYLEATLANAAASKADVRAALKAYFPQRRLFPLVRPHAEEGTLQKLNTLATSALRPAFKQQLEAFRAHVRALAGTPKGVGGVPLDGAAIVTLAEAVVAATNAGAAPSVQSTFGYLQERRCAAAVEEATRELLQAAAELTARLPLLAPALPLPPPPAFLQALPESRARFEAALAAAHAAAAERLAAANAAAAAAHLAGVLAAADDHAAAWAALATRLDGARLLALDVPARLHRACAARLEARTATADDALRRERAEAAERAAAAAAAERALRDELAEAALRPPAADGAHAEAMAALRADVGAALRDLTAQRDAALAAEAEAAGAATAQAERAAAEQRQREQEVAALRAELAAAAAQAQAPAPPAADAAAEAAALAALTAHFEAVAGAVGARAQEAEAALRERSAQLAACEAAAAEEAEAAREHVRRAAEAQERERQEHAARLAQRSQLLRESYDAMVKEAAKSRADANASERRVLLLEVERESLKRRAESQQLEGQELAKARRRCEELRERGAADALARDEAATALELERRQQQKLEAQLRELQQATGQREREHAFRIARLEVELAARGGPSLR